MKEISYEEFLVHHINSIEIKHPKIRQASKSPSFLLQFLGGIIGLIRQFGFSKKQATQIYDSFHELYKVSVKWTQKQIKKAHKRGYVTGAFNARLYTHKLKNTVYGSSRIPYDASQEARTAGNMLSGQSYGLLTIRAFALFMKKVRAHKKYSKRIYPIATIYDAIYLESDIDIDQIYWINKHLINDMHNIDKCPELKHPKVSMDAILCLYPDWSTEIRIPNGASKKTIRKIMKRNKLI